MTETTYNEAIENIVETMEDPGGAVVRTNADDDNLYDHLNALDYENDYHGAAYLTEYDERGVAYVTRMDDEGYRTDDVTLVFPGEVYEGVVAEEARA